MFRPIIFGKYVLLKRIAIGGMAEVFRAKAYGSEGFEKLVAIKRMLSHLSEDSQFVDMFINEAKLAATLNHANIVQIYDFGCIENAYFLSMEYVHGKDVADIIRMMRDRGLRAPVEMACFVMIEALNGLDYAHRQTDVYGHPLGLIHRDMSPHNIIVSHEGEVKIADFGIAKAKSSNVHTMGGVLKGKYSYMSPEQAHGMKLDHRTDLFSLGICMYELLTLTKMFQGQSDLNVLEKVRETDFVPPRRLNPDIPEGLERLLLKALEKNPDDRYRSAAEWRDALEQYLFQNNLHYSTSWLSSFMHDVFRDQLERAKAEFAEEVKLAAKLRTDAKKMAEVAVIRDTVVLKTGQLPDMPPIREVAVDEEEEPTSFDTARAGVPLGALRELRRRARLAELGADVDSPLEASEDDLEIIEAEDDVEVVQEIEEVVEAEAEDGEFSDYEDVEPRAVPVPGVELEMGFIEESAPTVELSRPRKAPMEFDELDSTTRNNNSPMVMEQPPGIREVPGPPIDDGELTDSVSVETPMDRSEVETFDDRSKRRDLSLPGAIPSGNTGEMPLMPQDFEESLPTLKNPKKKKRRDASMGDPELDRSTMHGEPKRFPFGTVMLILVLAGGAGALAALWFHGQKTDGGKGGSTVVDAGLVNIQPEPMRPDAGAEEPKPADEEKQIQHFVVEDGGSSEPVDAGTAEAPSAEDAGETPPPADEAVAVAPPDPVKDPPAVKKKKRKRRRRNRRRRNRRRVRGKCPTKGSGMLDVGTAGGWAYVYIDGEHKKTTPLYNYKIPAGRHKVQLKDGSGKVLRSWSVCVRANEKIRLFHQ